MTLILSKPPAQSAALAAADVEYRNTINLGLRLAEASEKAGGWEHMFSKNDGLDIEDPLKKSRTALALENSRRWQQTMDEATLSFSTGGYRDYIFPIVRAVAPNNAIDDIVSVQPQTRKNGTIYWLNIVIDHTRGQFIKGQVVNDANNGWSGQTGYTDEAINGETLGTTAASATFNFQTAEAPLVANTVHVTIAQGTGISFRDNGVGGWVLISDGGTGFTISSGNINYATGIGTIVFSSALTISLAVTGDYGVNLEGQLNLPQYGVEMQSTGVTAIRRPVSMRISMESFQDFQQEFGMDIGQIIVSSSAQMLLADVGGEVVRDLWIMAGPPIATFDLTPPPGTVSKLHHYLDLAIEIETASGQITNTTQRGEATFMIVDQNFANVLRSIGAPTFQAAPGMTSKMQGLVFIGVYNGLKVYRYKYMSTFPGASSYGNAIVGYKGDDWWDTGYVHAPYQTLYTNGPDERADLTRRQAWAMRYAKKRINANMYQRVALIQS